MKMAGTGEELPADILIVGCESLTLRVFGFCVALEAEGQCPKPSPEFTGVKLLL